MVLARKEADLVAVVLGKLGLLKRLAILAR